MSDRVVIESAFAPTKAYSIEDNIEFAQRLCVRAIDEGLIPIASHLLYPQFLDNTSADDRLFGINAGIHWGQFAQRVWFCLREGELLSKGMAYSSTYYRKMNKHIIFMLCHPDGELIRILEEKNKR